MKKKMNLAQFFIAIVIAMAPVVSGAEIRFRENCGMPNEESFTQSNGVLRFVLEDGDIGKCSSDPKPFRGASGYSKDFSERAEIVVTRPVLRRGQTFKVTFQHRVLEGYNNGDRNETFFQFKNCPDSRVPVMAFLRRDQGSNRRYAFSLAVGSSGHRFITRRDVANSLSPNWINYEINYSTANPSWIEISANGKILLPRVGFTNVGSCKNSDTLRLGNYRSGAERGAGRANSRSVSEYRNVKIEKMSD